MSNKIAIIGCKSTTQFLIENLIGSFEIDFLITVDAETATKNEVADYTDLRFFCKENGITCYTAASYALTRNEDCLFFKENKIDLCFVIGWQRLIPENILEMLAIGAFGMHGSAMGLPLGRGRSPLNWALIEGRKQFYTSLFKYDKGIDSGCIVDTYKFQVNEVDNAETLHLKNSLAMVHLIHRNLDALLKGQANLKTQDETISPTYYPKRNPTDSLIDWRQDIHAIERFIRAVSYPFNGAFTFTQRGIKLTIASAQIFDYSEFGYADAQAGEVVQVFANGKLLVKCFGGLLLVTHYRSDAILKRGDLLNNYQHTIKSFERNRHGNFDI